MSEKTNPEALAETELDAVAGGGCCDQIDCVRGWSGNQIVPQLCSGCDYFKLVYMRGQPVYICERPKK
jgi:hypothetical protein